MEKVKLPKEVAEAIESFKLDYNEYELFQIHRYVGERKAEVRAARIVNWIDLGRNADIYYTALVNGYEVEETPEDKVREKYKQWESESGAYKPNHYRIEGMMFALETLGKKIEGVNA